MQHLPWLKFYPKDWNGDANLRRCSLAARGLLAALLEPMHTAKPYGHLLIGGQKPDEKAIGKLACCRAGLVRAGLAELLKNGVLSRTRAGVVFSRRMKRDRKVLEKFAKSGRKGGNPRLKNSRTFQTDQQNQAFVETGVNPGVNQRVNGGVNAIEARCQKPEYVPAQKPQVRAPATKPPAPARVFLDWFQAEYKARRAGAAYFVAWEKHAPIVTRLLKLHPEPRLRLHATVLLTNNDEWIEGTDRGIEVLASKINWLEDRVSAWEATRAARVGSG